MIKALVTGTFTCLMLGLTQFANAQLLDEIVINPSTVGAEVNIRFTSQIQYLRHYPKDSGNKIQVYFRVLALDAPEPLPVDEYRKSPPSDLLPSFTVSYSPRGSCDAVSSNHCVVIQFSRPVQYKIKPGRDGYSMTLQVTTLTSPETTQPKSAK
jgi:hypothetical protein